MSELIRQRALVLASACVRACDNQLLPSIFRSSNPSVIIKAQYILSYTGEAEVRDNV